MVSTAMECDKIWLGNAREEFASANESAAMQTRSLLGRVISSAPVHSRFVNTLSMLEHMGSYRIMVTQSSTTSKHAVLRHLAEEAFHAAFLKRQAEKLIGESLDYSDEQLLAPPAARFYFKRLEAGLVRALGPAVGPQVVYLFTSLIIEFRALWFYELYQQTLWASGQAISLKRLIGEEQHHLVEMAEQLQSLRELVPERVTMFLNLERILYSRLLASFDRALVA